jgi:hypothetical protein
LPGVVLGHDLTPFQSAQRVMPRMTPADPARGGERGGKVWCRWVVRAQRSEPRPPKHGLAGRERQRLFFPLKGKWPRRCGAQGGTAQPFLSRVMDGNSHRRKPQCGFRCDSNTARPGGDAAAIALSCGGRC